MPSAPGLRSPPGQVIEVAPHLSGGETGGQPTRTDDLKEPVIARPPPYPVQGVYWEYKAAQATPEWSRDEALRQTWRERLVAAAAKYDDDPWAPEALYQAALLSDPNANEKWELLARCAAHPLVLAGTKVFACGELAGRAAALGDAVTAFGHLDAITATVRSSPTVRLRDWAYDLYDVLRRKAWVLSACGLTTYDGPGADFGKSQADFYTEARAVLVEMSDAIPDAPSQDAGLLWTQAQQLAREGRREEAEAAFDRLLVHPSAGSVAALTMIRFAKVEALYPEMGWDYLHALERIEAELPPDRWSQTLSMNIAFAYRMLHLGTETIRRVEPRFLSEAPEDVAWRNKSSLIHGSLLWALGHAYSCKDVRDYDRAVYYLQRLLGEHPEHSMCEPARAKLEDLYTRMSSVETTTSDEDH